MEADLQALVDAGKLTAKAGTALDQLKPQTFCLHKSWGFGRVNSWNLLLNQIVVDFQTKKSHQMQLQYAAETLQPLSDNHIYVRKILDSGGLKGLATEDPVRLVLTVLESFGGRVTQEQLQKTLDPEIVPNGEFKRWWDNSKKALRKNGRLSLPAKKAEYITMRDESLSFGDELILSFQSARQLKDQTTTLDHISKNADAFAGGESKLQVVIDQVEEMASRSQRLSPPQALELLVTRDEICTRFPQLAKGVSITIPQVLREQESHLGEVLSQIASAKQRRVLAELKVAFPDDWVSRCLAFLQTSSSRLINEIVRVLVEEGHTERLYQTFDRAIKEHSISSEAIYWLAKERGGHDFGNLLDSELLTAAFSALERDQFNENRRGSKLHDLLLEDRDLVPDLIINAPIPQARDLMRRMLLTPSFEELNKRSLMARMIKIHPELQSMLTGEQEEKEEALIVSWSSLQKKKEEYDDLTSKKIPENTKEISIARSYGDLRENFEYKAAKEMQTVLMRRKAELEQMLARARGSNFDNVDTSIVSIGTAVTVRDEQSQELIVYRILGAWDSAPEKHILSYLTAIGQSLLGKSPGEMVKLPTETGTRTLEVISIEPFNLPEIETVGAIGRE
ncbi:MAG: GreA/GreB family elongation factor [Verrucomicrobia bacterium]|nr:GreA/GreB family elongation factor [Verrucomicrobiota bacterium]